MKKSILLVILIAFSLLGISTMNRLKAGYYSSSPDETGADIYHVNVGNQRAYIHMTLPRYLNDTFNNSYSTNSAHETIFYDPQNIWYDRSIVNPDESLYNTFVIESKDNNGVFVNEFYSRESIYNSLRFTGTQDGIEISYRDAMFQAQAFFYLFDNTTYRMYWTKTIGYDNLNVDDLPNTTGSPYQNGNVGLVDFEINGSYLDITILYENEYSLKPLLVDDISIFKNVSSAYYYTHVDEKFITMTYENEPVFLKSVHSSASPWADTITWNLTTNEIRSINKVEVFAYHTKDSERNIFTYMYIPNLVHENIISVTAGFKYQFDYHFTGKGEEHSELVTLNVGVKNTVSPVWEKELLSVYEASPYKYLDSLLYKWLGIGKNPIKQLDQIKVISNPSRDLINRITLAWNEEYNTNVVIDTNTNKLYSLNWGQYDKFGAKDVYLIEDSFNFAEIVFVQNGKVNFLDFEDIILRDVTDESLIPKDSAFERILERIWEFISKFLLPVLILVSLAGAKLITSILPKKYGKKTGIYIIVALAIFIFIFLKLKG